MTDNLDRVAQRTQRYWYQDGLPEIAAGFLFLVGGLVIALAATPIVDPGTALALLLALALIVLAGVVEVAVGRGIQTLIDALKNRLTYPRTGYVSYRRPAPKKRSLRARIGLYLGLMVGSMTGAALVAAIISAASLPEWALSMAMTQGVLLAIVLVVMGYRYGLVRFYVLAALSLVIGMLVALNNGTFSGGALYFVTMGAVLALSGLATLAIYLRRYRLPEDG